jgi:alpha-galactosidase
MAIEFRPDEQAFFLQAGDSTYVMRVLPLGRLVHLYWGPGLNPQSMSRALELRDRAFGPNPVDIEARYSLDSITLEYPVAGTGDYRSPALEILQPSDGSRVLDLRYKEHRILLGKPPLPGLPATFANAEEAQTLVVDLVDAHLGLLVSLSYTVFEDLPVIVRSASLRNDGASSLIVQRALSTSVDYSSNYAGYQFVQLSGAWARERDLFTSSLRPGMQSIESRRGASSHQHNPFFALAELGDNEEHGKVFGFNLVYSGSFFAGVELDSHDVVRAQLGLNSYDFAWNLLPGEEFHTPEAVMVFSENGLGGMSRTYHRLYREHLCRGEWARKPRPIVINNWEATYFQFDADKLEAIARPAAELGMEVFVLDDGWFGHRDDDRSSLGDWAVDRRKLPGGLEDLAERIKSHGLEFGLWFEPEMISDDSDLYRTHPDWCLHVPGRPRSPGRNQLILDFSRADVREEIYGQIAETLRSVPIAYVKWDMNRHMSEIGSARLAPGAQQETAHRYMLGLYEFLERITSEFPHVLFEGCSGGGGRFDPGILHYMPQSWTSDNSDAVARLKVQYGTSLVYPWSSVSAHVSVVPNHQLGRVTPFRTRGDVAFTGAFGYELDISQLSAQDREEVKRQTSLYKECRLLLMEGDLYRLRSPFKSNGAAWMVVASDKSEAVVTRVTILAIANSNLEFLPLRGLDPAATYEVAETSERYGGDYLMQIGLPIPERHGDFLSSLWRLRRV